MPSHNQSPESDYSIREPYLSPEAFSRLDESDDRSFYARDRFVSHLDSVARSTVEKIIGELVTEENPVILDLMAGWDSPSPGRLEPGPGGGTGIKRE